MSKVVASITPLPVRADSRTYKMAASFARHGYRSVVVEGAPSALRHPPPFELVSAAPPARSGTVVPSRFGGIGTFRRDLARVARAVPPADLYYLHSYSPYPGVAWRRRRSPGALVYDAHDFYDELLGPGVGTRVKRRMQQVIIGNAQAFVTVSEGVADLYEDAYGRRPIVIRNAHDLRIDTPVARGLREAIGVPARARLLVVVGNDKPTMASAQLVDALALVAEDVHLAFVGRGHAERLERALHGPAAARVHLVDPVEPTEVVPFIASADVACVPYRAIGMNARHALPNGFFHAVAAGLPLLVPHDAVEVVDLAGDGAVVVDFSDPSSIAEGLRGVVDSADDAARRSAIDRTRSELTWAREEVRLLDLVRDVIGH